MVLLLYAHFFHLMAMRTDQYDILDGLNSFEKFSDLENFTGVKTTDLPTINLNHPINYTDLNSTIVTLKSYLIAVKKMRPSPAPNSDPKFSSFLNQALHLSRINLQLLGKTDKNQGLDGGHSSNIHKDAFINRRSSPNDDRSLGGGGGHCGGTSTLGIFNFLTFIVYAFALFVSLLKMATGSMADRLSGSLLPGVLSVLQNGRGKRALEGIDLDTIPGNLNYRQQKDSRHQEDSRYQADSRHQKDSRHQEDSRYQKDTRTSQKPFQEEVLRFFEHEMGSGFLTALLELSGIPAFDAMTCKSSLSRVTHNFIVKGATSRLN